METQVTGVEYTHELKAEFETKQHSPIEEIQTDNVFRIAFVRTSTYFNLRLKNQIINYLY